MIQGKTRILVVDDSAVYRKIVSEVVKSLPDVDLVGAAANGQMALNQMERTPVDLVLLDLEMPVLNGLETLEIIKTQFPTVKVVMVSAINNKSADITIKALEAGALDFVAKPEGSGVTENVQALKDRLIPILQHFGFSRGKQITQPSSKPISMPEHKPAIQPDTLKPPLASSVKTADKPLVPDKSALSTPTTNVPVKPVLSNVQPIRPGRFDVMVIGVSTGGPNALKDVIPKLPGDLGIPIFLVQHMPPVFTASLANNLNNQSQLTVKEAEAGEPVLPNTVYIAPGGQHMGVERSEGGLKISLNTDPPENSCRPAVDVLFRSVGQAYGKLKNVLAVVMTGMGSDGALGVQSLKQTSRCHCISQSAESCVVYGMPKAIVDMELSDEIVPLGTLANRLTTLLKGSVKEMQAP